MRVVGTGRADNARLRDTYGAARTQDWQQLGADCEKLLAEIAREIAERTFTLAELEEEEHSLERLRRWHRTLRARDVLGPSAGRDHAEELLDRCVQAIADFEQQVFDVTTPRPTEDT